MDLAAQSLINWGAAERPFGGEWESGDGYRVESLANSVLIAAVDGLGHGAEAARATRVALETVQTHAASPLSEIVLRCHEKLRLTRGAVMTLVSIDGATRTMTWVGVGNVAAALFRVGEGGVDRELLMLRGGLLGHQLPHVASDSLAVVPGDTLILATDGANWNPYGPPLRLDVPARMAQELLNRNAITNDDALVLVVRVR